MGAIGDYIHWSRAGYKDKDGHQEGPYLDGAQTAIDNRNDILNRWIIQQGKKNEAKVLEKEIDKILQQLQGFQEKSAHAGGGVELHEDAAAQALAADMLRVLPEKYVRMDLVEAFALGTLNKAAYHTATTNIKGSGSELQQVEYKQVKNQIENFLNSYIKNIEDTINSLETEVYKNDISTYINKIKNATDGFLTQVGTMQKNKSTFTKEFHTYEKEIKKMYKQLEQIIAKADPNSSTKLMSLCKSLANGLSAGIGANNSIGDIGEAIARLAGEKIGLTLKKEIEDVKTLGTDSSSRGLSTSHFSDKVQVQSLTHSKSNKKIGDFYLTSDSSKQDLVDVQIEFKTGKTMNLSVKTRKSSKSNVFKIEFEVANILELLQNENHEDFVNHFFNLNAIQGLQNQKERKNINILTRKLILAKLIAGYNRTVVGGQQLPADYFVIIDDKKFKAHVIPMRRLLQHIFEGSGQGALYNKVRLPVNLITANTYVEGKYGLPIRINNVMKRLAVSTKASYNFNESIVTSLKK